MDEFNPYPSYNPEDEYAPIEPEQQARPVIPEPQPAQPFVPEPQPAQPVFPYPQAQAQPEEPKPEEPKPIEPQQQAQSVYAVPPQQVQPVYPLPQQQPQQARPVYAVPPRQVQPVYPLPQQQPQQARPVYAMPPQQAQQIQPVYPAPQPQQQTQPVYPAQQFNPQQAQPANPYQQVFAQNQPVQPQPVYQQKPPVQKAPKQPTPTGTKVFIILLCALLVAMIVGFGIYIWKSTGDSLDNAANQFDSIFENYKNKNGNSSDPFSEIDDLFGDQKDSSDYSEMEDEISLVSDNGETQKRNEDNSESIGTPDEKAPVLVLNKLPSDSDNEKYTAKSAYEAVADSVVTVECFMDEITENDRDIAGSGSGTIISSDGYIITNAHVIGNSKVYLVSVILNNGKKYQAKIIGYDTWTDLAVLKIDAKDLKPVTFGDSKLINVGDDVIAIGSPGGEKFQNSMTKGIVSAVEREISINRYVRYIQSDAAISPGSSGGALCNIYGQVVGITTAKTVATYYENMSFSIPSETVKEIVDDLMRYGYVKGRCRIGLTGSEVSQEEIAYYGYPAGIIIEKIDPDGSLAKSDIKEGDILTELDGIEITGFQDVYDILADHKPGDKIKIKYIRFED